MSHDVLCWSYFKDDKVELIFFKLIKASKVAEELVLYKHYFTVVMVLTNIDGNHPFSTYAIFSEKLTFTPWYAVSSFMVIFSYEYIFIWISVIPWYSLWNVLQKNSYETTDVFTLKLDLTTYNKRGEKVSSFQNQSYVFTESFKEKFEMKWRCSAVLRT